MKKIKGNNKRGMAKDENTSEKYSINPADHIGLIYSIYNKMPWLKTVSTLEENDYINSGYIALDKAAKGFDESKGEFSSYASLLIRHELNNTYSDGKNHFKISGPDKTLRNKALKIKDEYIEKTGSEPMNDYLAMESNCDVDSLKAILEAFSPLQHLESPIGEEDLQLIDTVLDYRDTYSDVELKIYRAQLKEFLTKLMDEKLTERDAAILKRRYCWNGEKEITLKELGDLFDIPGPSVNSRLKAILRTLARSRHQIAACFPEMIQYTISTTPGFRMYGYKKMPESLFRTYYSEGDLIEINRDEYQMKRRYGNTFYVQRDNNIYKGGFQTVIDIEIGQGKVKMVQCGPLEFYCHKDMFKGC